jgi:hypothetical protein
MSDNFLNGLRQSPHTNQNSTIQINTDSTVNSRQLKVEMRRLCFDSAGLRDLVSSLAAERPN